MSVKLENKYIKNKLKAKFGELEVYNPELIEGEYQKIVKLIQENSESINEDNGSSDVQINNTVKIMREMLIYITNIENEQYWNNIDDIELDNMLNLADGDFKKVVQTLVDIMLEIGQDLRKDGIRKLDILENKLNEMIESIRFDMNIDKTLSKFGLDKEKLFKLQNGDKDTIEEFQKNILENKIKPKRQYNRKKK